MSVSERQRLRLCGQDLCGAFVRLYWQPTSKRAIERWRPTAQQKRLYLHHQGEFQHQNCTVGTVHDSDHEGVVRIFVRHSYHSNELFTLINYAAQFFLYQECNHCSLVVASINRLTVLYAILKCIIVLVVNYWHLDLCWLSGRQKTHCCGVEEVARLQHCGRSQLVGLQ